MSRTAAQFKKFARFEPRNKPLDDASLADRVRAVTRQAAWADVARRIAHEIKNPLTPIQLSAERLKRRYLKQIKDDPETFSICTDTIIRQVGDIGRMVDEFSSFARMPRPTVQAEDVKELCQQALFLQRSGNAGIRYRSTLPDHAVALNCDRRQVVVTATPDAEALLERFRELNVRQLRDLLSHLDATELAVVERSMGILDAAIDRAAAASTSAPSATTKPPSPRPQKSETRP